MYSACGNAVLPALGFPIRESADHRLFSAYPRLFAAVHALHRLLVPRHPPCALPILTVITRPARSRTRGDTRLLAWLCSFQGPRRGARPGWALGLSKLNSMGRARRARAPPGPVDVSVAAPAARHEAVDRARRKPGRAAPARNAPAAERPLQSWSFPRKEVIQPHLPVRLPCYDFTPVTSPTFDGSLPKGVRPPASGVACFRGVTGGVYKARERIHRGNADPRLLATPPSCRRVSACNPNRDAL